MAQRKKTKAKGKAKATRRRTAAKRATRRPARKAAGAGAADRRVAGLEAENERLRNEIAELRSQLAGREEAVPAFNLTADDASESH